MGRSHYFLNRLAEGVDLGEEPLPSQPIVEIAGDHRVLIENHYGVKEYSREKIGVKVRYGQVNICGECLELRHMTKQQLVIAGRINAITLCRRN